MALCQPVNPCPCQNWTIAPGDTLPLTIDWSGWLATVPGFSLNSVATVELLDLNVNPPAPADEDDIAIVSGMDVDPTNGEPGFTQIIAGVATQLLIQADKDVPVGQAYRLNIQINARDCNGRKISVWDCVFISISLV